MPLNRTHPTLQSSPRMDGCHLQRDNTEHSDQRCYRHASPTPTVDKSYTEADSEGFARGTRNPYVWSILMI